MPSRDLDRAQSALDRRMPDERCTTCTADACPTCEFNVGGQCYEGVPTDDEIREDAEDRRYHEKKDEGMIR